MPFDQYTPLSTLKSALKIPEADDTRDELLHIARKSAAHRIYTTTGRWFYLEDAATARTFNPRGRVVDTDDGQVLLTDDIGAVPTSIEFSSGGSAYGALDPDSYELYPLNALERGLAVEGLLRVRGYWLGGIMRRVRITARWGWPAVPDGVTQASLILSVRHYLRKDTPEGVAGNSEWGIIRMSRTDPDAYGLIEQLCLPGFG